MLRVWLALLMVALGAVPQPAFAIDDPDTLSITSTDVYRHLVEDDDFLLVVGYNISYATLPDEPASDAFILRLMDGTTELGVNVPYAFQDSGYGKGVISIYFDAASAPTWGQAYDVVLQGNPGLFAEPQTTTETLVSADYSTDATQAGNQSLLEARILSLASDLEAAWDLTLTTTTTLGELLNTNGEFYFSNAVPNLVNMAPGIFTTQLNSPTYTDETFTTTNEATMRDRFSGTYWIGGAFDRLETDYGMPANVWSGLLLTIPVLALMYQSRRMWDDIRPGMFAGAVLYLLGAWWGWVSPILVFIFAFLLIFVIAYSLFLSRT